MTAQPEAGKYYFYINILRIKVYILNMTFKKINYVKSGKVRTKRGGGKRENDYEPQNGSYSK